MTVSEQPVVDRALLLRALRPVPPRRTRVVYRMALAVTAAAMLLLPLLYVALTLGVAYATYWHARFNADMSSKRLYFVVIAGGVAAVLFMIKPLFAPRPKGPESLKLNPDDEPFLFAFVGKLCDAVNAPHPTSIAVNEQVNASAGLRRGFRSIATNDLELTIGLPLARSLDLNQFSGVLAHEFGHFSQGAGMRVSYIIRTVNAWFARVVYERDSWDEALKAGNLWALVIRFFVWITRRILALLMWIGHGISSFFMRQMEFDADSYEARLVGAEVFTQTVHELKRLGLSDHFARHDLGLAWQEGRIGDNLPEMIQQTRASLTPGHLKQLAEDVAEQTTGWFDTHPCDPERIQQVEQYGSGTFSVDLPATVLFRDFDAVATAVTLHHYNEDLGLGVSQQHLTSARGAREIAASRERESAWLQETLGFAPSMYVSVPVPTQIEGGGPAMDAVIRHQAAQDLLAAAAPFAEDLRQWFKLDEVIENIGAASALRGVKIGIDPEGFGLEDDDPATVAEALTAKTLAENDLLRQMAGKGELVKAAIGTYLDSVVASDDRDAAENSLALIAAIGAKGDTLRQLCRECTQLRTLIGNKELAPDTKTLDQAQVSVAQRLAQQVEALTGALKAAVADSADLSELAETATLRDPADVSVSEAWLLAADRSLQTAADLYRRAWGELSRICSQDPNERQPAADA